MFNRSVLCLVIASMLIFSGCLIKGRVVDGNGVGVAGVTVNLSGAKSMTSTTDSNGYYQFGNWQKDNQLPAGSYIVTPVGNFTPSSRNVTITIQTQGDLKDVPWFVDKVDFEAGAEWTATAPGFGEFTLFINSTITGITEIGYHFSNFSCGGVVMNGSITSSRLTPWPINNNQFTIEYEDPMSNLQITVTGTINKTGTYASGSWEAVSNGSICSGTWNASPTNEVSCNYSISPTNKSFSADGGTGSISVSSPSGCSWFASESDNWITITSGGTGSGNGTVTYSVSENSSSSSRSTNITVGGKSHTVTQSGANLKIAFLNVINNTPVTMQIFQDLQDLGYVPSGSTRKWSIPSGPHTFEACNVSLGCVTDTLTLSPGWTFNWTIN